MTINIKKVGDNYTAIVTPPHGNNTSWASSDPLSCDELIKQLSAIGCHQTDIGDAFYEANPHWLEEHEK